MTFAHRILASCSIACLLLGASEAFAQQTIRLTVAAGSPPTVTPAKMTKKVFIPEVNKRLKASGQNVKIEWTEAYNQTLAKFNEVFEAVEEGVAHVGVLLKNFEESKLPLEQYPSSIPFGITDTTEMSKADRSIRAKIPEMDAQFLKYNQVVLAHATGESQQLFTNFPVQKVEDLKGHKIGGSGALGLALRGTGAVLVTASMASSYTDIANGVYEGYVIHEGLAQPYKTYQVARYVAHADFGASVVGALSINKNTWDGLPKPVQAVFREAADVWLQEYVKWDQKKTETATAALKKEGVKTTKLPPAERQKWAKIMPNIAQEWAEAVEKQGLPGRKVLTAYMDEVRARGKPVREWDKE